MNTIQLSKYFVMSVALALSISACDSSNDAIPVAADQLASETIAKNSDGAQSPIEAADVRIIASLNATAADPLASGTARWESRPDRVTFTCEVEDVTTLGSHKVRVNGVTIGSVNVVAGLGDLDMDSRNGDTIPTMNIGDRFQVFNPSGRVILRGRF